MEHKRFKLWKGRQFLFWHIGLAMSTLMVSHSSCCRWLRAGEGLSDQEVLYWTDGLDKESASSALENMAITFTQSKIVYLHDIPLMVSGILKTGMALYKED